MTKTPFCWETPSRILFWPNSIKDRCLESQTPICKSFLLQYWRELRFSVFRTCFQGQIPIVWWLTVTFLILETILQLEFMVKKLGFFPKTCFRDPIICRKCKCKDICPFFDGWNPFFLLWINFLISILLFHIQIIQIFSAYFLGPWVLWKFTRSYGSPLSWKHYGRLDGQTGGRTDGRTNRWTEPQTNQWTDQPTDTPSCRDARMHLRHL